MFNEEKYLKCFSSFFIKNIFNFYTTTILQICSPISFLLANVICYSTQSLGFSKTFNNFSSSLPASG